MSEQAPQTPPPNTSQTVPVAGISYQEIEPADEPDFQIHRAYTPAAAIEASAAVPADSQTDQQPTDPTLRIPPPVTPPSPAGPPTPDTLRFPQAPSAAVDADHTRPENGSASVPEIVRYASKDGYFDYVDTYEQRGDQVVISRTQGTENEDGPRELVVTTENGDRFYNKGDTWVNLTASEENGNGQLSLINTDLRPAPNRPIVLSVGRPLRSALGRGAPRDLVTRVEVLTEMLEQRDAANDDQPHDREGRTNPIDEVDDRLEALQRIRLENSPARLTSGPDQAQRAWYREHRRPAQRELLRSGKFLTWLGARAAVAADYAFSTYDFRPNLYGRYAEKIDAVSLPADLRPELPPERIQRIASRLKESGGRRAKSAAERAVRAKNLIQRAGSTALGKAVELGGKALEQGSEMRWYAQTYVEGQAESARQKAARAKAVGRIALGHMIEAGGALSAEMQDTINRPPASKPADSPAGGELYDWQERGDF